MRVLAVLTEDDLNELELLVSKHFRLDEMKFLQSFIGQKVQRGVPEDLVNGDKEAA